MDVVEIDAVGVQTLQALVALSPKCLGTGVPLLDTVLPMDPSLGGNHHLIAAVTQPPADQLLTLPLVAVAESGVEEIDTRVQCGLECRDRLGIGHAQGGHSADRPTAHRHRRHVDPGRPDLDRRLKC